MLNPTAIDAMSSAMADVYASVTDRILINLAHHFQYIRDGRAPTGSFEYQSRMLAEMGQVTKESSDIIQSMLGGADEALKTVLENAIVESLKDEEPKLQQAAKLGLIGKGSIPELTPNQMQAFKSYYNQSADKLNLVNTVMLESTQAAYTGVISDIVNRINNTQSILNASAGEVITGVSAWNKAMHDAVHKMVSNGLTGFIDHAGRRWSPEAYVAMDIRTTLFNTGRAAIWERQEQYGNDLYQVSNHNGARPLCYPWQGKVISRTDMVRDVEDLDGNTVHVYAQSETTYGQAAGLFGINCKHYPMTFIPGFSTLKGEPQSEKANERTYEESQQQRALERKLRFEKRELSVLKAQGADQEAIKAQRNKVFEASADIDAFCDATGRARRRNREYTPINAKFPSKFGYDPKLFPTQQQQAMRNFFGNVAHHATKPKRERDIFNGVKGITDDFKRGMADCILASGNDTAVELYGKYADQLVCTNPNNKGSGAFYSSWRGGVTMNLQNVMNGSEYETPYEVAFHEFGHMIDDLATPGKPYFLSNTEIDGKRLLDVIKDDFKAFKKSMGAKTNDDLILMLKDEKMDHKTCGNISDVLEKCTNKSYPLGIGHGVGYHRREGATEREFFAEVLDSSVANKASYKQMQRLFPNAVTMVWKLIEGVLK